ncbi:MAG: hypothetical protein, partial [Olavius algarvensis Gamma 1 endosymbiont]
SSGTYGPFATSASRSRLRLPRTTRLALPWRAANVTRKEEKEIIRLVPVDNSLIFINFMSLLRAKRTDSLTNRF